MAFGIKLLQFTKPVAGTPPVTQISASLGFIPKGAISFHCNGNATGSTTSYTEHIGSGLGFSDGTTHRTVASYSADNSGNSLAKHVNRNSFIAITAAALSDEATVSFQADTITLSWNTRSANAAEVFVLVFGGSDITNCTVGDFASPLVAGNQTTTGTSFTPDCELYIQSGASTNDTAVTGAMPISLGFAKSSSEQIAMSAGSEDGRANMDNANWSRTTNCIAMMDPNIVNSELYEAAFSAFTSTGRTLTWGANITGSGSAKVYFMAIKGAQMNCGSFNVTAGTGNFSPVTSLSFTPSGWLFMANGTAASTTETTTPHRWAVGAAISSSSRACISINDQLGGTSINTKTHQTTKCLRLHTANATAGSSVTELDLDFISNNADGCTLNRVTNTTTLGNELVGWLAFGPSAAAGNAVERALTTETTTISEVSITRLAAKTRTRTDTAITVGESRARLAAKMRPLTTQTTALSENVIRIKGKVKTLATETITIGGGTIARLLAKIRIGSDTTAIAEARNRLAAKNRPLATQTTILSDSVVRIKGKIKSLATETVTVGGGTLARLSSKIRAISLQTIILSDNRTRLKAAMRPLAVQTIIISENRARLLSKIRAIPLQTITIGESSIRLATKIRVLAAQTVTITEDLQRTLTAGAQNIVKTITQTITLGESTSRLKASQRPIPQTITVDAGTIARLSIKIRTIPQTIILSDNGARLSTKLRALAAQTVVITDNRARIKGAVKTISQTIILTDNRVRLAAKARILATQTVAIVDNVVRQIIGGPVEIIRALTQTVVLSETVGRRLAAQRILSQTLPMAENLARVRGVLRTLSQSIPVSESRSRIKSALKPISQTVLTSESINRRNTLTRTLSQTVVTAENVIAETVGNLVRSMVETITVSDSIVRRTTKLVILDQFVIIAEQASRLSTKLRTIPAQTVTLTDSATQEINVIIKHVLKTLTQIISITDHLKLEVVKKSQRFRKITNPSIWKLKSNHPAWFLGTRGQHDHYEEFS